MRRAGTGLFRHREKSVGKSRWIKRIRPDLVFRDTHHECSHNPKEISALRTELVFRHIPGKSRQRRRQTQRFRRLGQSLAPVGNLHEKAAIKAGSTLA
jgi:hypothetical protein